jgi:hypothetical protein
MVGTQKPMQPLPLAWNQETGNRMIGADVWLVAVVSQDEKVPRHFLCCACAEISKMGDQHCVDQHFPIPVGCVTLGIHWALG